METLQLGVILGVAVIVLIVIATIAFILRKKCCPRIYSSDPLVEEGYIDNRSRSARLSETPPAYPGFLPYPATITTDYSIRTGSRTGTLDRPRPSRPSYADVTRHHLENERRRPRPYDDVQQPTVHRHQRDDSYKVQRHKVQPPQPKPQPPAKKIELDDNDVDINEMILNMQGNLREDQSPGKTISQVQNLLHFTTDKSLISQDCRIIIGVDATPAAQAGYCVNLKERSLSYYVIKREDLPWILHDAKDPSEFEMKNFMFALTVWENEILKWKRMRIYTDNFAITKAKCFDDNKYGERAFEVLRHYTNCNGVTVLNINNMAVNRFKNLKNFAKYIQPADDLSRWQINKAVEFLTKMYGIDQENVEGTHHIDMNRSRKMNGKAWYNPTKRYQQILRFSMDNINCPSCTNGSCSGANLLQASLRRNKLP